MTASSALEGTSRRFCMERGFRSELLDIAPGIVPVCAFLFDKKVISRSSVQWSVVRAGKTVGSQFGVAGLFGTGCVLLLPMNFRSVRNARSCLVEGNSVRFLKSLR